MIWFASWLLLLALALAVVGFSFAILRNLHWSALTFVLIIPIWIALLPILVMLAPVTFRKSRERVRHGGPNQAPWSDGAAGQAIKENSPFVHSTTQA